MKLMKTIGAWLAHRASMRKANELLRRDIQLREESERRLQVREFSGQLYICVDELPLFGVSDAGDLAPKLLSEIRENYRDYCRSKQSKPWNIK